MTPQPAPSYYRQGHGDNQLLPIDLMIQIFMHLCQCPQDLVNCALTTRHWAQPALQELYRHPWTYLFTYQFDSEGRAMDKHGSMLLLRTLFQGCLDQSRTTLPYANFARSVNLKWVHDTFDLPEVDIQTLTSFRWTRNEAPKDFLIRHLLAHRPYLSDFVHCHAPRLPRCLFAHMTAATVDQIADDTTDMDNVNTTIVLATDEAATNGSVASVEPANTINTANTTSTDSDGSANMTQGVTNDEFMPNIDVGLMITPPLLPAQQPVATAMPLAHPVPPSPSNSESSFSQLNDWPTIPHSQVLPTNGNSANANEINFPHTPLSPIALPPSPNPADTPTTTESIQAQVIDEEDEDADASIMGGTSQETGQAEVVSQVEGGDESMSLDGQNTMHAAEQTVLDPSMESDDEMTSMVSLVLEPGSSSSAQSVTVEPQTTYGFQQPYVPPFSQQQPHAATSSSTGSSTNPFLAAWPLTMEQTHSLVYLDLRYAIVSDALIVSLSLNCRKIQSLKVATHLQHFPHSYSVTDPALSCLVAAQHGLKLVHVENHREISQGHELVKTIDTLAKAHGETLETLVLKSHDFQNCRLSAFGKACKRLVKFSAPGGMHLFREEVLGLTEACKLTLEHLDFSNSDIETECLMSIMKGTSTPVAAKGVLKALVLSGMEDTLNQETCLAIGEHGSGMDCFRLDILESEARDVGLMLGRPCAINLRVLTLGCHDVHGDLANDILEQIGRNCRNVELLDVNHWQFSSKAIETVLRECGMLRYLNVSYTDIGETTAEVICRCLGEVKEIPKPIGAPAYDSLLTPIPGGVSSDSQLPSPIPTDTTVEEDSISMPMLDESEGHPCNEGADDIDQDGTEIQEEERFELLRKRGTEARVKGEEDEDGYEEYMDTNMDINMDNDQQLIAPMHSVNGVFKKQSQMGLVHNQPKNAMDIRTIMNIDLDEAVEMNLPMSVDEETGMDLDMRLDMQRYHRKSSKNSYASDNDYDDEMDDEIEDGDIEMEESFGDSQDEGQQSHSKKAKGKEIYVYRDDDKGDQSSCTMHSTWQDPLFSSSFGSTSSSTSSTSSMSPSLCPSSSSSSSSSSSFKGKAVDHMNQMQPLAINAGAQSSFECTTLLPPLPIPSGMEDASNEFATTYLASAIQSVGAVVSSSSGTMGSITASGSDEATPEYKEAKSSTMDNATANTDTPAATPSSAVIHFTLAETSSETPLPAPTTVAISASAPEQDDDSVDEESFAWTKESRLEQINVECCSMLSLSTVTKIKTLGMADRARRGKSRTWAENEHDMMMSRLEMERGPELPLERLRTSIALSAGNTGISNNSGEEAASTEITTTIATNDTVAAESNSVGEQEMSDAPIQQEAADEPMAMTTAVEVAA
ncbi:hypothetical protein BG011_004387 [Mortierella polycephala]|uniref:F-box domain-containing protein n=1 Tax=Mortierella polycephala TaxID=41804 RepID=A0A9P6QCJ4_9FUNG|nr:hypothetical protein BG011_004387 [Mortierella polycephala]